MADAKRIEIRVRCPGLTDDQFSQVADQCAAISVPDITDARVDGWDDEIMFRATVLAGSQDAARDKLRGFAARVLERALSAQ